MGQEPDAQRQSAPLRLTAWQRPGDPGLSPRSRCVGPRALLRPFRCPSCVESRKAGLHGSGVNGSEIASSRGMSLTPDTRPGASSLGPNAPRPATRSDGGLSDGIRHDRPMSALPRLLAILLLVVAALALVPSVLSPGDLPCHRDLLDFVVPLKVHFARTVAEGQIPWWDPWTLGGRPFLANLQAQVFYPPNLIHLVLDLPWALSIFLAGHLLLGGLGARRLSLALGAGEAPALLAGAAYLGGGFLVSLTDLTNQLCTAAWLPWTWLAALSFGRRPGARSLAAWSACVLLSLLGAAPQHAALGGLSSLVFAALAQRAGGFVLGWRRSLGAGALAAALAVLAGAAQFGPFAELLTQSDRTVGSVLDTEGKHALTASALVSFVRAPEHAWDAPAGPFVRSLYLGPLVLLAAAAAALRRDRWTIALASIAALSLLLAAGTALPGPSRWLVAPGWRRSPSHCWRQWAGNA